MSDVCGPSIISTSRALGPALLLLLFSPLFLGAALCISNKLYSPVIFVTITDLLPGRIGPRRTGVFKREKNHWRIDKLSPGPLNRSLNRSKWTALSTGPCITIDEATAATQAFKQARRAFGLKVSHGPKRVSASRYDVEFS